MQRRWAAIYLAFFLVMAAGAFSMMTFAEEPQPDVDGETYQAGDTVEIDGVTYTFAEVEGGSGTIEYEDPEGGEGEEGEEGEDGEETPEEGGEGGEGGEGEEAEDGTQEISLEEGAVIQLGDEDFVVTFVDDQTVMLSEDLEGYQQYEQNTQEFEHRLSGLTYVIIFSLGGGFLIATLAFMPRRG